MSTISITVGDTSKTWFMPELQGQRLALTFSSNGLAQLWLEDSNVLQTANTGSGSTTPVILTVTHPFGWWNTSSYVPGSTAWSSTNNYQRTSASYAIIYAFEAHSDCLKWRQQQLDAYRQQGYSDTSTQVVTETLNVMGLSWLVQTELSQQMLAREWGQLEQNHHRFGRMSQEQGKGYYVDAFLQMSSMLPDSGFNLVDQQRWHQTGDVGSYLRSAMEHGIIEQLQSSNLTAASTVKMLAMAGTNTQGVYITSYTNWISVSNNLINYGSTLSNLDYLIKSGWTLLVPKDGSNHLAGPGTWAGYGYVQSFYSATPSNIKTAAMFRSQSRSILRGLPIPVRFNQATILLPPR
ncbi:MAG: hypothetical protein NTW03_03040 [Verrucomicrobia bacterium]|nr:hypothetical protein [Verrucomicrobiota bacterium]